MTDVLSAADEPFESRGVLDIPHPGSTLLTHLRRVRGLPASCNADVELQSAGLCHAACRTD